MTVNCPNCGSQRFYFIQKTWCWHKIADIDPETGEVETCGFVNDDPTDTFRLECQQCNWKGSGKDYGKKIEERYKE